jgi:hypothetical protein
MYVQTQGGPTAGYVIVQGPDGTPVAVPAQAGGPIIEPSGTPALNQTGASGTSAVPPHYVVSVLKGTSLTFCSLDYKQVMAWVLLRNKFT